MGVDLTGDSIQFADLTDWQRELAVNRTCRVARAYGWDAATVLDMLGIGGVA